MMTVDRRRDNQNRKAMISAALIILFLLGYCLWRPFFDSFFFVVSADGKTPTFFRNALPWLRLFRQKSSLPPITTSAIRSSALVELDVTVRGDPVRVWGSVDMYKKCHISDFPDIPTRAFAVQNSVSNKSNEQDNYTIHMIQGSTSAHITTGPDLFNITRSCSISYNMTGNSDPSMFAGNEFLDSTVVFSNGTVVALSHTEYPGDKYNNCPGPHYPHCWTVTTGLMISYDFGTTWQHAKPPPSHLVAAVPYAYNATQLASGWGDPTNIVEASDGFYYVAMWNRNQVGLQAPGVCMMRTESLLEPSSWRGWNGTSYGTTFVSPYHRSNDPHWNPAQHLCKVLDVDASVLNPTKCSPFGLVWSTSLKLYLMSWSCLSDGPFYMTSSSDLIHWSTPQRFYEKSMLSPSISRHVTSIHYPSLIDPRAPLLYKDPNYSTITSEPYLFWVSFGHSPYSDGRTVWATPLRIRSNKA